MDSQQWNERYSKPGFAFGTAPNEFLETVATQMPKGPVLTIGEGEGRNAIFLAGLGYDVVAVDQSEVALAKLRQWAQEKSLHIQTQQADLANYPIEPGAWAGIVSIFCHLPPTIRIPLYAAIAKGLRPGGVFILEAYTPSQIGRGTGGPSAVDMLLTVDALTRELPGLKFLHAQELERDVREGSSHTGLSSVVQLVAQRGK